MATNCPPHNLGEIVDGLLALLDDPDMVPIKMLDYVSGPDFPTGALIYGRQGIHDYISTGRGKVIMRARAEIEELPNGRDAIIVTEIPYYVNKAELILKIAALVREGTIAGIADLADQSDRQGMRIVVTLKKDAPGQVVLNQLFKHTPMQSTFGVKNLSLGGSRRGTRTLKATMQQYLDFREIVIVRRTQHDLRKAEERAHILEGYRIALDHIDAVIELIRSSQDSETARTGLMTKFELSEIQAQAILDMRLARLTGLERDKIEKEYEELIQEIERLRSILASRSMQLDIIRTELGEIREKYADERRTEIVEGEDTDLNFEDLIAEEDMVVSMSHLQYVKRLPETSYKAQIRGGRGIAGAKVKEEDWIEHLFIASTHDTVLFFTSAGRVFLKKVYQIPEAGRTARGKAIVNLLQLGADETVSAFVRIAGDFDSSRQIMFATRNGLVKRTSLDQFLNIRTSGIRAIELVDGDRLMGVRLVDESKDLILALRCGKAIRFNVSDARCMGRSARGVKGVELNSVDDAVVGMMTVDSDATGLTVLSVTERGYGKRSPIEDYRRQGRGGKGIITMKTSTRNGAVAAIHRVEEDDELMVMTKRGVVIRMGVEGISTMGRNTQGVKLINLGDGDFVASVAPVAKPAAIEDDLDDGEGEE
jgi:DNA gyrase subunit A